MSLRPRNSIPAEKGGRLADVLSVGMQNSKRERFMPPPCHDELRYEDGELINQDKHNRLQGSSAKFTREKEEWLPIGESLKSSEQMRGLGKYTQTSWETVLRELYSDRTDPPTRPSAKQRAGEAFVSRYDNHAKPQFYLLTTTQEAILSHIQPNGVFWEDNNGIRDIKNPKVGDVCYTNGFIWTNPSPGWSWKNKSNKRIIRVIIDVPAGTQVVIDRAPVYSGVECQFDEHRESLFPDVLLTPAEFIVTNVVRYRSTEEDYSNSDEPTENFIYVDPVMRGRPKNDLEYAKLRVFDVVEFMDVRVTMVSQIKLPSVGSVKFT